MPRAARIVIPGVAHHVTQRGNRQQAIFFGDDDYSAYLNILRIALLRHGTRCLAWCLMPNHVHLMLVPQTVDGLRATLASAHTTYAQRINQQQQASGHLFQGRFASYAMDEAHMMVAARYIENNPVKARMTKSAEDWHWSSARAHIERRDDGLTDIAALGQHLPNWAAMLRGGLEAAEQVEGALLTGRPMGESEWLHSHGVVPSTKRRGRPFSVNRDSPSLIK
jgi:putative transposase